MYVACSLLGGGTSASIELIGQSDFRIGGVNQKRCSSILFLFFVFLDSSFLSLTGDLYPPTLIPLSSFSGKKKPPSWYPWHVHAERDREEGERRGQGIVKNQKKKQGKGKISKNARDEKSS